MFSLQYVTKGSDACIFGVADAKERRDEVATYQLGRYISSNEAVWRTFGFPIHDHFPPVQHLVVHLENGQRMHFNPSQSLEGRLLEPPKTTLTAYFDLNKKDAFAQTLLYPEIPQHYRFVNKEWKVGKQNPNVGRVYTVSPNNRECYFLRLLLHNVRGPTSFEDLRTVNGMLCETYQQACEMLGLLESDNHWRLALTEAEGTMNPKRMRELFAIMLASCEMSSPNKLWQEFKESMCEDLLYQVK